MLDFWWGRMGTIFEVSREMGLTPGHTKALLVLDPGTGRAMGSLADEVGCDASSATWLVDRLEERGFVERHMLPEDRRVRAITLTKEGERVRAALLKRLYEPPDDLLALDRKSLVRLRDCLSALPVPED